MDDPCIFLTVLMFAVAVVVPVRGGPVSVAYLQQRENLLRADRQTGLGANLVLNVQEQMLDKIILREKKALMDPSIYNRTIYSPSLSFYKSKATMEKTNLFKIIQSMPKGGILHIHDLAMGSLDWLVKNATYREHIYMCVDKDSFINFAAFLKPPQNPDFHFTSILPQVEAEFDFLRGGPSC
ncbi:adenosine deaminase CECR1 [Elysia marginata]|uniref:Adenosine deaminase CECR1 n=1 Tax=Elysia marginata TaxID=1093978 RepID=A0AAV4ELA4_9GAST|nr:adenosine deaminase CECR1 [Elysia marginata]